MVAIIIWIYIVVLRCGVNPSWGGGEWYVVSPMGRDFILIFIALLEEKRTCFGRRAVMLS